MVDWILKKSVDIEDSAHESWRVSGITFIRYSEGQKNVNLYNLKLFGGMKYNIPKHGSK